MTSDRSILLNEKCIRTRNIFHAAILINCGAQLVDIIRPEDSDSHKSCEIVLGLSLLDKRAASRKFQEVAEDLSTPARNRSLRDVLENSILSDIESTYFKLRRQINAAAYPEQ
jgi:hypothetical protein